MFFLNHLFHNKKDNYKACWLFIVFFLFYAANNYPFIMYMKDSAAALAGHSPFYGAPFMLNLFNFDPSMYYGPSNTSIIHPFINFLSGPFTFISKHVMGNLFFLVMQSVINALSVVMIYYYLRKTDTGNTIPLIFSAFFGVSSYTIFTAMIPDSYPYVQFVIIFSVLYLQYSKMKAKTDILPSASVALANFALTSTNIVPFVGALFFNIFDKHDNKVIKKFITIIATVLLMAVVVTVLQNIVFKGDSWINNWIQSLSNGGFSYVAAFSLSQHWQAIYMLVINPILTPNITLVDQGIVAFATDLTRPYPFYVSIIGFTLIVLAILGFIKGIKSKESWIIATYILFAIGLHIVVGYGLATFTYDLYLYAGHYLFAFFLLSARFIMQINHGFLKKALVGIVLVFVLVTLSNNTIKHVEALNYIKQSYVDMKDVVK